MSEEKNERWKKKEKYEKKSWQPKVFLYWVISDVYSAVKCAIAVEFLINKFGELCVCMQCTLALHPKPHIRTHNMNQTSFNFMDLWYARLRLCLFAQMRKFSCSTISSSQLLLSEQIKCSFSSEFSGFDISYMFFFLCFFFFFFFIFCILFLSSFSPVFLTKNKTFKKSCYDWV